ncbi:MAG: phosphosulfolactate synthase, partial [Sediminibacterium sp.]|nr:phosphosulfolactate synthase [Sediminibacterium sp.]
MNFNLTKIPERTTKNRESGVTMVMDKGLGLNELKNLIDRAHPFIDFIKLGFGTAYVMMQLKESVKIIHEANIKVYFGGTLFEAFYIRNQLQDYINICEEYGIDCVEISDGSITIEEVEKCRLIEKFAKKTQVLSEVGSKDITKIIPPYKWINMMQSELDAGASFVIAESRESGTVGIYRGSGEVREGLVEEILTKIPANKIIWEAPKKEQQLYFLNLIGCNANLGNIPPSEIIALEAMRIGLRSDSFHFYL